MKSAKCKVQNVEPSISRCPVWSDTLHSLLCTRHSSLRLNFRTLRSVVLLTGLITLTAVADEPRPDGPAPTSDGFFEFPSAEFQREQLQARQAADAILIQFQTRRLSPKFEDQPLDQVVQQLGKLTKTLFQIDRDALAEEGIQHDMPITFAVRKAPRVADVLDRILKPLQLDWYLEGNVVYVTTITKQKNLLQTKAYRVGNLLRLQAERDVRLPPAEPTVEQNPQRSQLPEITTVGGHLEQSLQSATPGPWKERDSQGGAKPQVFAEQMLVQQSSQMHREVAALVRCLELALARPFGSPPLFVAETDEIANESARLQRLIETELDVDLTDTPLNEAVQRFSDKLDEGIVLDIEALTEEGIQLDFPVTFRGRGSLRTVLQQLSDQLHLTLEIRHGAIFITTSSTSLRHLKPVVYDVADFLQLRHSIRELMQVIEDSIDGTWASTGEGGTITEFRGGLLVIRQTAEVHFEIAGLLSDLRKTLRADSQSPRVKNAECQTRFHRAKSKAEATALERVLPTLVAPGRWNVSDGRSLIGTADDRLIIHQTNAVHEQIDRFLREYQQAKPIESLGR